MKNLKKLSREGKKVIVAGIDFPAYCIEGGGPGEGGCSVGTICSGGKCVPYGGEPGGWRWKSRRGRSVYLYLSLGNLYPKYSLSGILLYNRIIK